jgi:hypothetical protein
MHAENGTQVPRGRGCVSTAMPDRCRRTVPFRWKSPLWMRAVMCRLKTARVSHTHQEQCIAGVVYAVARSAAAVRARDKLSALLINPTWENA